MLNQKHLNQLLIYVNLYQHAKIQDILLICSGYMFDQKILQSDWVNIVWHIYQEPKFSQVWNLCRSTTNNINFQYRTNSVKNNDQISQ